MACFKIWDLRQSLRVNLVRLLKKYSREPKHQERTPPINTDRYALRI